MGKNRGWFLPGLTHPLLLPPLRPPACRRLVKRYLRPQDAYVHADVHGAATVVLRHTSADPDAGRSLPQLNRRTGWAC